MARKIPVLGRVLGAPALYAMAYGEIGGSLYYALGITAVYAVTLTPVIFLVAGFLFALAAAAYAEGGATIPEAGGAAAFSRRAFNDLVGFVAGWAAILDYIIGIALAALFVPHYLAGAINDPHRFSNGEATVIAVALVLAMTVARVVRRTEAYEFAIVLAALDIVVQAGLAVFGLVLFFDWHALQAQVDIGVTPTWSSLAFSLPIAMIAFTGLEKIASTAAEARDPTKTLPDSIRSSVLTTIIVYAAVATAAVSAFPSHPDPNAPGGATSGLTTTWLNAPMLGLSHVVGSHYGPSVADVMQAIVGFTAVALLLMAISTSFSGFTRLALAMAERRELPSRFGRRSRRALLPASGFITVGVLAALFLIVGYVYGPDEEVLTLASLYSYGILIAFMLACASIVWLRIAEPEMPRPFRMHGNLPIAGRSLPMPAVLGAALAFVAWVICLGTHPGARVVGTLWMLAGLGLYAFVRIRAGLPLMERVEVLGPPAPEILEGPSTAIVVPLERHDAIAEEVMATACRLAAERGATVVGVSAIMIPVRYPLDDPRPEREEEVAAAQRMAHALADDYEVPYIGIATRTRSPGRTIVDAVIEHNADLIVIGSPAKRRVARNREEAFFGRTVDFVLRKAPCRVIVTHFPPGAELEEIQSEEEEAQPAHG
jgi:APA family basic amino acid/polyamine antiporter